MEQINILPLSDVGMPTIAKTFNCAFSDYAIKRELSTMALTEMLMSRSYVAKLSFGAFAGCNLLAVICVGSRNNLAGDLKLYICSMGVIPKCRRQGLAKKLLNNVIGVASEIGAKSIELEVITDNNSALTLYKRLGFISTRELVCADIIANDLPKGDNKKNILVYENWRLIDDKWCDFIPTWQNQDETICWLKDDIVAMQYEYANEVIGQMLVNKKNGAVMRLAVKSDWRRQNIATALLANLRSMNMERFCFVNIEKGSSLEKFILKRGGRVTVKQYAMSLNTE